MLLKILLKNLRLLIGVKFVCKKKNILIEKYIDMSEK